MKIILTSLALVLSAASFGQWANSVNSGGNPAHNIPYNDSNPWYEYFIEGRPYILSKTLNFSTQKMEDKGIEKYIKDAKGNYTQMLQTSYTGTVLDTTFWHNNNFNYSGNNPTTYRLESWYNGSMTSIRNAVATFNSNGFEKVNYTDSNFLSGIPPITYAMDTFIYNGSNELIEAIYKMDTGNGMYNFERHRYTYNNGKPTGHFTDEWDVTNTLWVNADWNKITYDANGFKDSLLEFSWDSQNSLWFAGDGMDYDYDASGKLIKWISLNDDGSGGRDFDDMYEFTYGTNSQISTIKMSSHDGTTWNLDATREATYNAAGDTLQKVEQKVSFGPTTVVMFAWHCTENQGPPASPPAAPSALTGSVVSRAASDKAITLTWTDNSNNEDGFTIERMKAGGAYATLGAVIANISTYKDTSSLEESTDYKYRVMATKVGVGSSAPSNELSISMPANGPVSVAAISSNSMKVYPNPASHQINIAGLENGAYRMIDLLGNEKVSTTPFLGNVVINTSHLDSGFYVLQIESKDGVSFKQIQILK